MEIMELLTLQSLRILLPHAFILLITYVSVILAMNQVVFAHVNVRCFCCLDIAWHFIHYEATQGL